LRSLSMTLLLLAAPVFAQPAAGPAFDVASIKLVADPSPWHWDVSPGKLHLHNMNLKQCVLTAYHVEDFQVEGGPGWADSDHYDIDGKADHAAQRDELLLMLRTLLAERFHLSLQTKPQKVEGYSMTVAQNGLLMRPDTSEGAPSIQVLRGRMAVTRFPMGGLAQALSNIMRMPVSDDTGVEGSFSFKLDWTPEGDNSPLPITLPEALREKIGLRLQRAKVSIPVFTIAHAEKPDSN